MFARYCFCLNALHVVQISDITVLALSFSPLGCERSQPRLHISLGLSELECKIVQFQFLEVQ